MKIELKKCWHVAGWSEKIEEGEGVEMKIGEGFFTSEKVLFYKDKQYSLLSTKEVCFEHANAVERLQSEKKSYIEYLKREVEKNTKKLKDLGVKQGPILT
jgi:hypothetical protein